MEIILNPDLETLIQMQIDRGHYASPTEVIAAGVRLLATTEQIYQGRFEELRREIMIGVEAADKGEMLDADEVFRQMQEKLDQKRHTSS
ncbi:ribbon-helix-helix domain-containing protein [Trichothermofontia sp.]